MKTLKILFVCILLMSANCIFAQDPPSGYTTWYKLRMWLDGDNPGADSVNQNLIDLDLHLKNRDLRIDTLKSAFSWMFNYPSGTWKRYNSTEFDDDTLKVKSGVFPKLSLNNIFTGTNTFEGGEVKFDQDFGTTLNFIFDNDLGGIFIKKNNSTTLMEYDENDGNYWQFMYPLVVTGDVDITGDYKINGVPISPGGGDAYLGNTQTFTRKNTFDSLFVNKITSDLPFYKAANTWIWTKDNFKLFLGANNDTAIEIGTDNNVRFHENIIVDNSVTSFALTAETINNLTGLTTLTDLTVMGNTSLSDVVTDISLNKGEDTWLHTEDNYPLYLGSNGDTAMKINTTNEVEFYESISVDGTIESNEINATTISNILGQTTLNDLNVTGDTDVQDISTGYAKVGADATYVATKLIRFKNPATTNLTTSIPHGIDDWRRVLSFTFIIQEDSLNRNIPMGYNATTGLTTGNTVWIDTTNFNYYLPTNSVNLEEDSCFVYITYRK